MSTAGYGAPSVLSPLQLAAAGPFSTSCSPLPLTQAAAAARIADKPDVIEACKKQDLSLLADHLMVDPTRARARDSR
jgi:hypothetical protein